MLPIPQSRLKRVAITAEQSLDNPSGNMEVGFQVICRLSALTRVELLFSTYPNHRDLYNASTVRPLLCCGRKPKINPNRETSKAGATMVLLDSSKAWRCQGLTSFHSLGWRVMCQGRELS
jgi:hypothetical protein